MNTGTFYLYEYENYNRKRNVGFIKVSRHYQSCILQIHARGIPVKNGSTLNLSAFCCEQDKMITSQIADLTSCGRNISVRLSVSETHFPERRTLQQIDGFLLQNPSIDTSLIFWMASSFFFDITPDMMRTDEPEAAPAAEPESATKPALQTAEAKNLPQDSDCAGTAVDLRAYRAKKISREDLTLLPQRFWFLANNSFLLHGYHNYNHLALIEENGRRWLGVPGIYDTREARAADLFGFPRFTRTYVSVLELTDEERNDMADFGHWCRCVGTI